MGNHYKSLSEKERKNICCLPLSLLILFSIFLIIIMRRWRLQGGGASFWPQKGGGGGGDILGRKKGGRNSDKGGESEVKCLLAQGALALCDEKHHSCVWVSLCSVA